jgi:hypothetical protein
MIAYGSMTGMNFSILGSKKTSKTEVDPNGDKDQVV